MSAKSLRIRDYIRANPKATAKQISHLFKVSAQQVYTAKWLLRREAKAIDAQAVISDIKFLPVTPVQHDMVNSPPHYTAGGIETIDFIQAKLTPEQYKGYLLGNILKYSSRIGLKGQEAQDAGKLNWYTRRLDLAYQADLNDK